jgi:hypothetical protein
MTDRPLPPHAYRQRLADECEGHARAWMKADDPKTASNVIVHAGRTLINNSGTILAALRSSPAQGPSEPAAAMREAAAKVAEEHGVKFPGMIGSRLSAEYISKAIRALPLRPEPAAAKYAPVNDEDGWDMVGVARGAYNEPDPAPLSPSERDKALGAMRDLVKYVEWHMPLHKDEDQHPTYSKPVADARAAIAALEGK